MLYSFLAMLATSMIVGCGGGDDPEPTPTAITPTATPPTPTPVVNAVNMGNVTYHVPSSTNVVASQNVNQFTSMMGSGSANRLGGFAQNLGLMSQNTRNIGTAQTFMNNAPFTSSMSQLSKQTLTAPYNFTIAHYRLVTNAGMQSFNLSEQISNIIFGQAAPNSAGVSAAPSGATGAGETVFRYVLFYGESEGTSFYISTVVPESEFAQFETTVSEIHTAARATPLGETLQQTTQVFTTATSSSHNADFLFVVDDSGSMSDDQDGLAKAAKDFTAELSGSGLAYRSAIITTGYGADDYVSGAAYEILRNVGIIENNDALLEQELVAGTSGSGTETGIWNAENALQSTAHGDAADGPVTQAGMPVSGASMSVIIISDEKSQYDRRAPGLFDPNNNLFVDRGITVYSIIRPVDDPNSQYDDLSLATQGMTADIDNRDSNGNLDYSVIMKQIAQDAGGASSSFILDHYAVNIMSVTVNGAAVAADAVNGYTYVQSSKAIVFHGTAVPAGGSTVEVTYEY